MPRKDFFFPAKALIVALAVCSFLSACDTDTKEPEQRKVGAPPTQVDASEVLRIVEASNVKALTTLLQTGLDPNSIIAAKGMTLLMRSAQLGDVSITRALINAGADVNRVDEYGNTALLQSIAEGHLETAKLLLQHHADPNLQTIGAGASALGIASKSGNVEIVKLLSNFGADLNIKEYQLHMTPLALASLHGHEAVVQALLKAGADPNIHSDDGLTPAAIASSRGYKQIALLFEGGGEGRFGLSVPAGWHMYYPFTNHTKYWPEYTVFSAPRDSAETRRLLIRSSITDESQIFLMFGDQKEWTQYYNQKVAELRQSPIHTVTAITGVETQDRVPVSLLSIEVASGLLAGDPSRHVIGIAHDPTSTQPTVLVVDAGGAPASFDPQEVQRVLNSLRFAVFH